MTPEQQIALDGGPAFPVSRRKTENYMDEGGYGRSRTVTVDEGGMSLRLPGRWLDAGDEALVPKRAVRMQEQSR